MMARSGKTFGCVLVESLRLIVPIGVNRRGSHVSNARVLTECAELRLAAALSGVVQGSHLGLEIDVSTFRSVQDTLKFRRSKECSRLLGCS